MWLEALDAMQLKQHLQMLKQKKTFILLLNFYGPNNPEPVKGAMLTQSTLMDKIQVDMVYVAAMTAALRKPAVGCFSDFRNFVMRGNVLDLAVAVIIGAAFNNVVNSLVTGIITPAILNPALRAANITDISQLTYHGILYGSFLSSCISFFIIATVLFLLVKIFESSRREIIKLVLNEDTDTSSAENCDSKNSDKTQQELIESINGLTQAIKHLSNKAPFSDESSRCVNDNSSFSELHYASSRNSSLPASQKVRTTAPIPMQSPAELRKAE